VIVSSNSYDYTLMTACVHRIGIQLKKNVLKSDIRVIWLCTLCACRDHWVFTSCSFIFCMQLLWGT